MKIKYPVRPSPVIPRVFLEVTLSFRFPFSLVPVNADEDPMLILPRHRRTDLLICHVLRSSVSFAARSYFRPLDVGVIVFMCARL